MYKVARLICLSILVGIMLLPAGNASAALLKCRTDPIFVLSNGDVINVTLDISTDASSVSHIAYVLHLPTGVTVQKIVYTAVNLRLHETYQVYQDSPARTYTTTTLVTTRTLHRVEVMSMTRLNGILAKYVSGYSGESLIVNVSRNEASRGFWR